LIRVVRACQGELSVMPEEVQGDLADALARLQIGWRLSMPLSRPMPEVGPGVHELRLTDRTGTYRVLYAVGGGEVILLHAFKKTTRRTPPRVIRLTRKRLRKAGR
jgi:phage-related protein